MSSRTTAPPEAATLERTATLAAPLPRPARDLRAAVEPDIGAPRGSAARSAISEAAGTLRTRTRTRADSLASRAAAERAYVREDLRRIGLVSAVMLAALVVAWVMLVVVDVGSLY